MALLGSVKFGLILCKTTLEVGQFAVMT